MHTRRSTRLVLVAVVLATIAAACSSGDPGQVGGPEPGAEQPKQGGALVLGAGGEPACADWYLPCGNNIWGIRTMALQTLPTPMEFIDGQYRPSSLLAGEPTVEVGPPQRVTYRINPRAVWSDGTPITSADFRYSWEQGKAANFRGMGEIASVDDVDPRTAVVRWTNPSASWRDRFRPPASEAPPRREGPQRRDEGRLPLLRRTLDHRPLDEGPRDQAGSQSPLLGIASSSRLRRLQGHHRLGGLPAGVQDGSGRRGLPHCRRCRSRSSSRSVADTAFEVSPSLTYAIFVLNTKRPPLDSKAVRQALAYATDRDAIAKNLLATLKPDVRATQSVMSPANTEWYSEPFARYRKDLTRVNELMRADGWNRGADGFWAKEGNTARVEISIASGLRVAELAAQILHSQWRDAGFDASIDVTTNTALGGERVPRGNYQVVYASVAPGSADPELCPSYCSRNVPTEGNRFQGGNVSRISSPALDDALERVNTELDPGKRRELVRRAQEALADEVAVLPFAGMLDVFVSRATKVGGPVSSTPAFLRLSEWFCKTVCS